MTVNLSPTPYQRFVDSNGNALSGGLLYTYAAGTTTPQATYTDSTGGTPNTNPIVLNTRGEASIWLDPTLTYKFVLQTSGGASIWTQDNISPYVGVNYFQNAEVQIASASTTDIGSAASAFIQITGTTTITSFGVNYKGPKFLRFAAGLTLTNNASTLILPGGANIVTAAGDNCIAIPIGSPASGWKVVAFQRAAAAPAFRATNTVSQAVTSGVSTKVHLNSVTFDTTSAFDPTTNYRFQPLVPGYYQINGAVYLTGSAITTAVTSLQKNGVEFAGTFHTIPAAGDHKLAAGDVVFLNGSTDYVELWGTGTGTTVNFGTNSYLSGALVLRT